MEELYPDGWDVPLLACFIWGFVGPEATMASRMPSPLVKRPPIIRKMGLIGLSPFSLLLMIGGQHSPIRRFNGGNAFALFRTAYDWHAQRRAT
jgi:hypothetical protein